jgi:hypothetical protein
VHRLKSQTAALMQPHHIEMANQRSGGKPIDPIPNVPASRDFHHGIWAGEVCIATNEKKLRYPLFYDPEQLYGYFRSALRIKEDWRWLKPGDPKMQFAVGGAWLILVLEALELRTHDIGDQRRCQRSPSLQNLLRYLREAFTNFIPRPRP